MKYFFARSLHERLEKQLPSEIISPTDTMMNQWYFSVGKSAAMTIINACGHSNLLTVEHLLEIPCGHGRVTRWLRLLFPDARIDCCDLDTDGVDFCCNTFNANGIYSNEDIRKIDFKCKYQIIFVGSLFTHIAEDTSRIWLQHLSQFLAPSGIIIATTHGRTALKMSKTVPFIDQEKWDKVVNQYLTSGYGYQSYTLKGNIAKHEYIIGDYGVSLCSVSKFASMIEKVHGVQILSYSEGEWADLQDVVVIGKI